MFNIEHLLFFNLMSKRLNSAWDRTGRLNRSGPRRGC